MGYCLKSFARARMFSFLWQYYARPEGFEVRLFCLFLIYRLGPQNIVAAHVVDGVFNFKAVAALGGHPWNVVSMGNRLFPRQWVLLEKRRWPRFLAITPKDPEVFVRALGVDSRR